MDKILIYMSPDLEELWKDQHSPQVIKSRTHLLSKILQESQKKILREMRSKSVNEITKQ